MLQYGGRLVPQFDAAALADAVRALLDAESDEGRGERARAFWRRPDVSFQSYVYDLLAFLDRAPRRVSAVVPNFNYARFLPERLGTILGQTYPVSELVILDDASTDESRVVIEQQLAHIDIPVTVIANATNSGSVFRQWLKGAEAATGDFVWIAEADDLSEPEFLAEVMRGFDHDHVVLSYCQSRQMATDGSILCDNYLDYVKDVSPTQWAHDYLRGGADEIAEGLSVKNTIPNVSAVVFRRHDLVETMQSHLDEILSFRVAGDWCTYVRLLSRGSCAYFARSLNRHRRHDESVTIRRFGWPELREIERMQQVAARTGSPPAIMSSAAATYLKTLQHQFKLDPADA